MTEDPRTARRTAGRPRDRGIFVVEVWREAGAFRAVARDVAQEHAQWFDEPAGLAAYLSAQPADGKLPPA